MQTVHQRGFANRGLAGNNRCGRRRPRVLYQTLRLKGRVRRGGSRSLLRSDPGRPSAGSLVRVETVDFHTLGGERFISTSGSLEPALNEHLTELGRGNGFVPDVIHEVAGISEALELVAAGIGITLVRASSAALLQARGVVFRECAESLTVEVGLAYPLERTPVAVEQLVNLLRQPVIENA